MARYLGTQLLTTKLLTDFGIGDVPPKYRATVLLGILCTPVITPFATPMWLRWHSFRRFGVVLFGHQSTRGGFWRSAGGDIDGVDAQP